MKIKPYLSVLFILLLITACEDEEQKEFTVEEVKSVEIVPIKKEKIQHIVRATGLFSTEQGAFLSFASSGIIKKIYVKEGEFVKKGQLLATLNLTPIQAKASQVKLAVEKAARDYSRAKQLYKDSVATLEQFQNAKTQLEVTKQQLEMIEFQLEHSKIKATSAGYVLFRLADEGQIIDAGMPVFRMNATGEGKWLVKVGVSGKQWTTIHKGDSAQISIDALSHPVQGKVVRKARGINPNTGTFTIYVKPTTTSDLPLASGMFSEVVIFGETDTTIAISYMALLGGDKGEGYVFVTNDRKTAHKVPIKIKDIRDDNVLVSSGLDEYNYLIIAGSPYLEDGSAISVKEKE